MPVRTTRRRGVKLDPHPLFPMLQAVTILRFYTHVPPG